MKPFTGGNEQISDHNYEVNRNNDFLRNPSFLGYPERVPFRRIKEVTFTQRLMKEELYNPTVPTMWDWNFRIES